MSCRSRVARRRRPRVPPCAPTIADASAEGAEGADLYGEVIRSRINEQMRAVAMAALGEVVSSVVEDEIGPDDAKFAWIVAQVAECRAYIVAAEQERWKTK